MHSAAGNCSALRGPILAERLQHECARCFAASCSVPHCLASELAFGVPTVCAQLLALPPATERANLPRLQNALRRRRLSARALAACILAQCCMRQRNSAADSRSAWHRTPHSPLGRCCCVCRFVAQEARGRPACSAARSSACCRRLRGREERIAEACRYPKSHSRQQANCAAGLARGAERNFAKLRLARALLVAGGRPAERIALIGWFRCNSRCCFCKSSRARPFPLGERACWLLMSP